MKRFISFFAVVPIAAVLLTACNAINISDEGESAIPERQNYVSNPDVSVSLAEAYDIAGSFFYSDAGNGLLPTKSVDSSTKTISKSATIKEDGQDLMYVFNYEGGGFVIVGSTRNYYPILAYSDKGSFELQDDMGPVDVWLDETKFSIKNSSSLDDSTKSQMQNLWARYDGTYVDSTQEMLAARRSQTRSTGEDYCWARIDSLQLLYGSEGWTFTTVSYAEQIFEDAGLSSYYADICYSAAQNHSALNETVIGYKNSPILESEGPLLTTSGWHQDYPFDYLCNGNPAGCTVIAAAQIMKYYEFPPSSHLNWNGIPFAWNQIMDTPDYNLTASRQPQLVRYIGTRFGITYLNGDSGATPEDVRDGLEDMGYTVSLINHNYLLAYSQIYGYGQPVFMSGKKTLLGNTGHAWVCDGARKNIFNQITFFTENQPYGAGSFSQGMYTMLNPGVVGGTVSYYFYMKYGIDYYESEDGWYAENVFPADHNYQYSRKDILITNPN